ncbi:MAG: transposase, partial [Pseudonocardiaceae bacterium]
FDARWRYAAGVGSYDCDGWTRFAHTVLVDMRARLAASKDPRRIFDVTVEAAGAAGLIGAKRVLDSTPLYDAVATMDTITLVRSAIRALLKVACPEEEVALRALLRSGDDYATSGKPQIDWDDKEAREALVDSRAKDGFALLAHLDGAELDPLVADAARLLATVLGQDLEEAGDGVFRIARRVAKDRVISTVDPEARHGHKTSARGFDGYKGHAAIDPDSEIVTDTVVSAGNAGDASVAEELIDDLLCDDAPPDEANGQPEPRGAEAPVIPGEDEGPTEGADTTAATVPAARRGGGGASRGRRDKAGRRAQRAARHGAKNTARRLAAREAGRSKDRASCDVSKKMATPAPTERPRVYGDAAYGAGAFLDHLARNDIDSFCKTQPPVAPSGRFAKDRFTIDLDADQVTCPAGVTVGIARDAKGDGIAHFATACAGCPLRDQCTTAKGGRTIQVGRYEHRLAEARREQQEAAWKDEYRATRPKVERKLGHMMFRKHGGRRARVRGRTKVDADFNLLAAAQNLARLATLGLRSGGGTWEVAGA